MKLHVLARFLSVASFCLIIAPLIVITQCDDNDPIAPVVHECGSGDVNLNDTAYEMADVEIMLNYFLHGSSAFSIDSERQANATDVNCNGALCEIADFVYIIRTIVGDAVPYDELSRYHDLRVAYSDALIGVNKNVGAALFVFDGQADISLVYNTRDMEIKTDYNDGLTRVLVYSPAHSFIEAGNVLKFSDGELVSIKAADYYGTPYSIKLRRQTASFTISPNPFYDKTNMTITLSEPSDYRIGIYTIDGNIADSVTGFCAGARTIKWNSGDLRGGIYYVSFEADGAQVVKKMIILPAD